MPERPKFPVRPLFQWIQLVGATAGIVLLFFPQTPFAFRFVVGGLALLGAVLIVGHHHGRIREWRRFAAWWRGRERLEHREPATETRRRSSSGRRAA